MKDQQKYFSEAAVLQATKSLMLRGKERYFV